MWLGELLIAEDRIQLADLERALVRRKEVGGDLSQHLLAMGAIDPAQLDAIRSRLPRRPRSIEESGLSLTFLASLMLKSMYVKGLHTASAIVAELQLSGLIVEPLVGYLRERQFIEPLGSAVSPDDPFDVHFTLSEAGRERAIEALEQSEYVGPAPVPLAAFEAQIRKQKLAQDLVDRGALRQGLSHLMLSSELLDRIGPALNSGQPILMFGPPGNGKSSIANGAARCFRQVIYLPRCIEVDGQIVKVFDPTIHEQVTLADADDGKALAIRQGTYDPRWVCCRRPRISAGVELTLEMLDLNFHQHAHFYDAPLQMKASGGVLIVDGFGRQMQRPNEILNRWIVPLEHGADYLTLETGKKFSYAFDVLLIFSTDLPLNEIMNPDLMRRIPYRIRVSAPSRDEFVLLLKQECAAHDIELSDSLLSFLLDELYAAKKRPFARHHPRFIIEHLAACAKYNRRPVQLDRAILAAALDDLFTED